jgi:hypothetical protein
MYSSIDDCLSSFTGMNIGHHEGNAASENAMMVCLKCRDMTNLYYYKQSLLHSPRAWNYVGSHYTAAEFSALPIEILRNTLLMHTVIDAAVRENNINLIVLLVEDWYESVLWSALEHSNYSAANVCVEWQHPKDMPKEAMSKLTNRAIELKDSHFLSLLFNIGMGNLGAPYS